MSVSALADLRDVGQAEQVGDRDAEQLPAAQPAHRATASAAGSLVPAGGGRGGLGRAAPSRGRARRQLGVVGRASRPPPARAAAGRWRSGWTPSTCASRSATAPSSRSSRRYQGVVAERVADLPEAEQAGVGVGRVGEPAEHHRQQRALDRGAPRHPGGQRLEVPQRARGVGVAERLQPRAGRLRGEPGLVPGQPRHRAAAAAGRTASRAAGGPRGRAAATAAVNSADRVGAQAAARGRGGAGRPRRRARGGCGAAGAAGGGAPPRRRNR